MPMPIILIQEGEISISPEVVAKRVLRAVETHKDAPEFRLVVVGRDSGIITSGSPRDLDL